MMFFTMIPRGVYVVIGALLVLFGLYRYGFHKGWNERDVEMQAEISKKNEESRAKEQAMTTKLNEHETKLTEANHALDEKSSALDRAIASGRVRLRAPSCVQAAPNPAAPSSDRDQARSQPDRQVDEAADSDRATLAAIAAIVADGDRAINQLNACIDAYQEVRKQVNGDR